MMAPSAQRCNELQMNRIGRAPKSPTCIFEKRSTLFLKIVQSDVFQPDLSRPELDLVTTFPSELFVHPHEPSRFLVALLFPCKGVRVRAVYAKSVA